MKIINLELPFLHKRIISAVTIEVELTTNDTDDLLSVCMPQQHKRVGLKNGRFSLCTFLQEGQ